MGKNTDTPQDNGNQETTEIIITELEHAQRYLKACMHNDVPVDEGILLMLINVAEAKLDYYLRKYINIEVPFDDFFEIEDVVKFGIRNAELKAASQRREGV